MSTAVVIGGGISGLSSAFYLNRSAKYSKVWLLLFFSGLLYFRICTVSDN